MSLAAIERKLMLSAKEVALLIGKSSRSVRRWGLTAQHDFPAPAIRKGHPRWRRTDVEKWIEEQS